MKQNIHRNDTNYNHSKKNAKKHVEGIFCLGKIEADLALKIHIKNEILKPQALQINYVLF